MNQLNDYDIKVGDKVYWRKRMGVFLRTYSGKVESIDKKGMATVPVQTQHIFGRRDRIHVSSLTKNKKQ